MSILVDESEPVGEIEPPFESRDVQIRRSTNVHDFIDLEGEIGRGKFGTVYKCHEKKTGLRLAAKFIQVPKKADRINVEREVEIMKLLRSPRLIQLYDAFDDGKKEICLLLELIEGGELFERVIDDDFILTERACAIFMRQICEGIQFMHLQRVLHLDMKPENILCLTKTGNRIKLIDFGLARRFDPSKKLQVLFGTPEFVAPEVVNFEQIGFGTDLWSVGIICYVLLSGLSPFMGETDVETMANVTIAKYDFDDEAFNDVSDEAQDFISKLLVKSLSKRLTATECLRHSWLQIKPLPKETPKAAPPKEVSELIPAPESSQPLEKPIEKPPEKSTTMAVNSAPSAPEPDSTILPLSSVVEIPVQVAESQPASKPVPKDQTNNQPTNQTRIKDGIEEMLLTKNNLRQFVERWSSHPNSPFLYDGSRRTTISLISPTGPPPVSWSQIPSRASLSGMSPSAPSSLASPWQSPAQVLESCDATQSAVFNHYSVDGLQSDSEGMCQQQVEANCNSNIGNSDASNNNVVAKNAKDCTADANVKIAIEETSVLLKSVTEKLLHQLETGTAVRDRTGARIWERNNAVGTVQAEVVSTEKTQVAQCQVQIDQRPDQPGVTDLSQMKVSTVSADSKTVQPSNDAKPRLPDRKSKSPVFGDHRFGGNGLVHVIRKTETFTSSDKKFKGFSLPDKKPKIPAQQQQQQQQPQQQQQQQQQQQHQDQKSKTRVVAMDVQVEKLTSSSDSNSISISSSSSKNSEHVSRENVATGSRPIRGPMTDDNVQVEGPNLVGDGDWEFHPPVAARTMGISKRHKGNTLSTLSSESNLNTSSSVIRTEETLITDKEKTLSVAYSVSNTSTVVKMETQL